MYLPPVFSPTAPALLAPPSERHFRMFFETWWPDNIMSTDAVSSGGFGIAQYDHDLWAQEHVMFEIKVRPYQYGGPSSVARFGDVVEQHIAKCAARSKTFRGYFMDIYPVCVPAGYASTPSGYFAPLFGHTGDTIGVDADTGLFVANSVSANRSMLTDTFANARAELEGRDLPLPLGLFNTSEYGLDQGNLPGFIGKSRLDPRAATETVSSVGTLLQLIEQGIVKADGSPWANNDWDNGTVIGGRFWPNALRASEGVYSAFAADNEKLTRVYGIADAVHDYARGEGLVKPFRDVFGDLPYFEYIGSGVGRQTFTHGTSGDATSRRQYPTEPPTGPNHKGLPWVSVGHMPCFQGFGMNTGYGAAGWDNPVYEGTDPNTWPIPYKTQYPTNAYFYHWMQFYRKPVDAHPLFFEANLPIPGRPTGFEAFTFGDYCWSALAQAKEALYNCAKCNPGQPKGAFFTLQYFGFSNPGGATAAQVNKVSELRLHCLKEIFRYALDLGYRDFGVWEQSYNYAQQTATFGGVTKTTEQWWLEIYQEMATYYEELQDRLYPESGGAGGSPTRPYGRTPGWTRRR